jgi:hypothetical protein
MNTHQGIEALFAAALIAAPWAAAAQPAGSAAAAFSAEQQEADYRVIAARCGTPAFEKAFFNQSRAAVNAGLVSRNRPPADVEKTITALRRSPFVLVAAPADCPAQLKQLAELQKSRSQLIRTSRERKVAAR